MSKGQMLTVSIAVGIITFVVSNLVIVGSVPYFPGRSVIPWVIAIALSKIAYDRINVPR